MIQQLAHHRHKLYLWSGYLAALCLASIGVVTIGQIVGRFIGVTIDSTESAGFLLAGATFLGLAHTYKSGDHIRITLLTRKATGRLSLWLQVWATGFCVVAMLYFSYWAADFVYYSYVFGDISPGLLSIPFWIPRSLMAIGVIVFTVALIDDFVSLLRGEDPTADTASHPPLKSG